MYLKYSMKKDDPMTNNFVRVYIKMGEVHRLANDGILPVVLIEAQVGDYTGEDDFERV